MKVRFGLRAAFLLADAGWPARTITACPLDSDLYSPPLFNPPLLFVLR